MIIRIARMLILFFVGQLYIIINSGTQKKLKLANSYPCPAPALLLTGMKQGYIKYVQRSKISIDILPRPCLQENKWEFKVWTVKQIGL